MRSVLALLTQTPDAGLAKTLSKEDGRNAKESGCGEKRRPSALMLTYQVLCRLLRLTPREAEVLCWVTQGKRHDEIGLMLGVSSRTVQKHLQHIFGKLGAQTRMAVAVLRVLPLPWHWSQDRPRDGTVSQTIDDSPGRQGSPDGGAGHHTWLRHAKGGKAERVHIVI